MSHQVPLYDSSYGNFASDLLRQVRREAYGEEFGQTSWLTAEEYRRFFDYLELSAKDHVLDAGCGSGAPAMFLAREMGCRVTGVDVNAAGIHAARELARQDGPGQQVQFLEADLGQPLPVPPGSFDAIVCMDVICHLRARDRLFAEWRRLLRPGGRLLFTDPVVVTGLVSRDEFATRSSIGHFEFGPKGLNERLLRKAGFELLLTKDVTSNEVEVSKRWHDARQRRSAELVALEGEETFQGFQRFLDVVNRLTAEGRLSRFAYLARNPGA
jgi:SAM-dependent methyltransferase